MVSYMDGVVSKIVDALRHKRMWQATLLLFASDNGGPIYYPGSANNYPLKACHRPSCALHFGGMGALDCL